MSRQGKSRRPSQAAAAPVERQENVFGDGSRQIDSILKDPEAPALSTGPADSTFLAHQPLSLMQAAVNISRDMQQFTLADNDFFSPQCVPAGQQQVVLKIEIPCAFDLDMGGLVNISMIPEQRVVVKPYETYDVAMPTGKTEHAHGPGAYAWKDSVGASGDRTVTMLRREILEPILLLTCLHAIHLNQLAIWQEDTNSVIAGRRALSQHLRDFGIFKENNENRWYSYGRTIYSSLEELDQLPWSFFLESVCDDTGASVVRSRIWCVIRHSRAFEHVNRMQVLAQHYVSERYSEDFHHMHGPKMGHRQGDVRQEDRDAMNQAQRANRNRELAAGLENDLQNTVEVEVKPDPEGGGAAAAPAAGAPPAKKAAAARSNGRVRPIATGEAFGRRYGMPKDSIPAERLDQNESLLASWERVVLDVIGKTACNTGISESKLKRFIATTNISHDFHAFIATATSEEKARLLQQCRDYFMAEGIATADDPITFDMLSQLPGGAVTLDADVVSANVSQEDEHAKEHFAASMSHFAATLGNYARVDNAESVYQTRRRANQGKKQFGLKTVGLYNQRGFNASDDYISACPEQNQTSSNLIQYASPFVLFPAHNLFANCTGSRVCVDQVDARNYFRTETSPMPIGPNSYVKCVPRVLTNWINELGIDLNEYDAQFCNVGNVAALALCTELRIVDSNFITKVDVLGRNFKGFPIPERVFWLSPRLTLPWTAGLIHIPPAPPRPIVNSKLKAANTHQANTTYNLCENFQNVLDPEVPINETEILYRLRTRSLVADTPQAFWIIRKAMCMLFPSNAVDAKIRTSTLFFYLVFGSRQDVASALNDIDGKLLANDNGLSKVTLKADTISRLLLLNGLMRVLATTSIPLFKYWAVGEHRLLDIHGERTLRAVIDRIPVDGNAFVAETESWEMDGAVLQSSGFRYNSESKKISVPGFFDSEPEELSSDHLTSPKWEELYYAMKTVDERLADHLRRDFGRDIVPKFVTPMALLKRTMYGAVPEFSPANFVSTDAERELAQGKWYSNIALALPEDQKAATAARALVLAQARARQLSLRGNDPAASEQLAQRVEEYQLQVEQNAAAGESTGNTDSERTGFVSQIVIEGRDADDNGGGGRGGASAGRTPTVYSRYDPSVPQFASKTSHNGWIKMSPLGAEKTEPQNKLRNEGMNSEFVGDLNLQLSAMIDNIVSPLEIWIARVQSIRDRAKQKKLAVDDTWRRNISILQSGVASFIYDMKALDYLFCMQNMYPMIYLNKIRLDPAKDLHKYDNDGSVVMPTAFACAITTWRDGLGHTSTVAQIPFDEYLHNYETLETPFSRQIAMFTVTIGDLGIGANGTYEKITFASTLYECAMSSPVLSRAKEFLHSMILMQFGAQAGGKSFTAYMLQKLLLIETLKQVTSASTLSMNAQGVINDGLLVGYDEGDKDATENHNKESDLKNAWSNGYLIREVITDGHVKRFIVSSHRCAVMWNANFSPDLLSGPIVSRSIQLISSSIESSKSQSAEGSFANYAGQAASVNEKTRETFHQRAMLPWNIVHAIKIIIEIFTYAGVLNPDPTIAVETSSLLMEGFKGRNDWGPEMVRYNTLLSLAIRSCTTTHAAFRVACDAALHFSIRRHQQHYRVIPIGFIIERARHYLFATTGMAVYELTLLFDGYVNNKQHTDVGMGILATPVLQRVFKTPEGIYNGHIECPFLLAPINRANARGVVGGIDNNPMADQDSRTPHVKWSDDPAVFDEPSPIESATADEEGQRYAIDLNYVVVSFSSQTYKKNWVETISKNMPTKYGLEHLFSIIRRMETRTVDVESHERNKIWCGSYNNMLSGGIRQKHIDSDDELDLEYVDDPNERAEIRAKNMARAIKRREAPRKRPSATLGAASKGNKDTKINPDLYCISMQAAVALKLPLVRYDAASTLPVLKMMTPSAPPPAKGEARGAPRPRASKLPFVVAVNIKFLEECLTLLRAGENDRSFSPTQTDMNLIIEAGLSRILQKMPYPTCVPMQWFNTEKNAFDPKVIRTEVENGRRRRLIQPPRTFVEKMPSGVSTNVSSSQLATISTAMIEKVLAANPRYKTCDALMQFLRGIPHMFKRDNIIVGVRDTIKGKYEATEPVILRNTANLRDRYEVVATPLACLLQIPNQNWFTSVDTQFIGLQRAVTAAFENLRVKNRIGIDIKGLKYSPDWLAFVRYCLTQRPPLDPCNIMNQMALPMVANAYYSVMAGTKVSAANAIMDAAATRNKSAKRKLELLTRSTSIDAVAFDNNNSMAAPEQIRDSRDSVESAGSSQPPASKRLKIIGLKKSDSSVSADSNSSEPGKLAGAANGRGSKPSSQLVRDPSMIDENAMDVDIPEPPKPDVAPPRRRSARVPQCIAEDTEQSVSTRRSSRRLTGAAAAASQEEENDADLNGNDDDGEQKQDTEVANGSQLEGPAHNPDHGPEVFDLSLEDARLPYPMNIYAGEIRYHIWAFACRKFSKHLDIVMGKRPALFPLISSERWLEMLCNSVEAVVKTVSADDAMDM